MSHPIWTRYLAATAERGARPLVEDLLAGGAPPEAGPPGRALDLGCGAGGDTLALLTAGYRVLAVDAEQEALERTRRRAETAGVAAGLDVRQVRFEELELDPEAFDLVVASFALPFCAPERFDALWRELSDALVPGGIFLGQLFGDRDAWTREADHPSRVFLTRAEVEERLASFEPLALEEVEERRETAIGGEKDWHLFHFVVRKRARA